PEVEPKLSVIDRTVLNDLILYSADVEKPISMGNCHIPQKERVHRILDVEADARPIPYRYVVDNKVLPPKQPESRPVVCGGIVAEHVAAKRTTYVPLFYFEAGVVACGDHAFHHRAIPRANAYGASADRAVFHRPLEDSDAKTVDVEWRGSGGSGKTADGVPLEVEGGPGRNIQDTEPPVIVRAKCRWAHEVVVE